MRTQPNPQVQTASPAHPISILIAEDSPTQAERLRHLLEQQHYRVHLALNGRQALEMTRALRPAMVISDVVMPEMDGYALSHSIKHAPELRNTPVILVTSLSDPADVIRGLESGADNFILKPYDEHYLLNRVRYVLANVQTSHVDETRMGLDIQFNGQRHFIESDRLQILNLLLSTYEAGVRRNAELQLAQEALSRSNEALSAANRQLMAESEARERLVIERTIALQRSEREFAATFEDAAIGIAQIDLDGRFNRVNHKLGQICGYRDGELHALRFQDLVPPEDNGAVSHALAALREGKDDSVTLEHHMTRRDGRPIWVRFTASQVHDENGATVYLLVFVEDISHGKRTEEALAISETLLHETRALARVGGWEYATDDGSMTWTEEINLIHELPTVSHPDLSAWLALYTPPCAKALRHALQQAVTAGKPFDLELESVTSSGAQRWVHVIGKVDLARGRVYGALQDVTERKQSEIAIRKLNEELEERVAARTAELDQANVVLAAREEEIRSVVDHMVDCVITIDENGIVRSANQVMEHIFGYRVDELIGNNIAMLMDPSQREAHDNRLLHYRSTGVPHVIGVERQVVGRHRNGEQILLTVAISEYRVQGRRYFTGILRDIREHVRIIEDLQHARQEAERANQAKSAFLATMSHEIRTPMNGVIGMADVLQQTSLKPHQMEMVNLIRESAFSLLTIIDDILDFSKIEAGKLELETTPMSIEEVADKTCAILDRVAAKRGVELTLFTSPALPRGMLGDPLRVRQILVNLISNAIKFSSGRNVPGRVAVRIEPVERGESAGQDAAQVEVRLSVCDNGIGMDADTKHRLFTSFTQADASTTRRFGGTGLGLAITRHLIQLMGGTIALDSEPEQGSNFTVHLPFRLQAEAVAAPSMTLADLSCFVFGPRTGLGDDLAAYLADTGAKVMRADTMDQARLEIPAMDMGPWLFVVDAVPGESSPVATLRSLFRARAASPQSMASSSFAASLAASAARGEPHFLVVMRGRRRQERSELGDVVMLDANAMTRHAFLQAVAVAVGRPSVDAGEVSAPNAGIARAPTREDALRQGRLVLVAEDNETNQKVILQQCALLGVAADLAKDGREALKRWQETDYGLVLTDLHMPEMDGYALTAAIRAEETGRRRIPIIALTANALKGEAEHCKAAGMDDYLSKPAQLNDLRRMLARWLPPQPTAISGASTPETVPVHAKVLDVGVLEALVGGDEAIIKEFLQNFRSGARTIARELLDAHESGRVALAASLAHKLKSSARAVGAMVLGDVCAEIEQAGNLNQTGKLDALLVEFGQQLKAVEYALREFLDPGRQNDE